MATTDVVARLQLRAEQFSSETGKAFAEMKTRAASTAQDVRNSFGGALAEVQKVAQQALTIPRNAAGALDLSAEITQLRSSAAAAENRSQALAEMAQAQYAAARAAGVDAQALKLEADAAAVASLAEDQNATAIRRRIGALEAVQTELNRTTSATRLHAAAGTAVVASSGQQRAAMQQLGFQLNDVSTQFAAGTPVLTIFAQQSGQVVQALGMMSNGTKGVLGFLGGPWGAVVTAATLVMVPFIGRLLEGNDAIGDAVEKLKDDAAQTEATRQAKERFATTTEGVTAAIRAQTAATKASEEAEKSAGERANIAAKQNLESIVGIQKKTLALIEQARAEYELSVSIGGQMIAGEAGTQAGQFARDRLKELTDKAAEQARAVAEAERNVLSSRALLAEETAKRSIDPLEQINRRYRDMATAARRAAVGTGEVTTALTRQLAVIERERQAAVKAEQERQQRERKTTKPPALGDAIEAAQGQRLLASARGFNGAGERSRALKSLFAEANVQIDPKMVAWCAAFVNAVLATNGMPGTGSLSARSFLNYGTATDKPQQGDIVVLKRGTGGQGHTGFYSGTDAKGNVLVTGGNQGDQVSTAAFARKDVLGFRRAPTAADSYTDELKAQEEAARKVAEAERDLAALYISTTSALDPATASLVTYRKTLEDIERLVSAGKLAPDLAESYASGARQRLDAAQSQIANDNFRNAFGGAEIDKTIADLDDALNRVAEESAQTQIEGSLRAAEAFRDGISAAADLFGVRLADPLRALLQPGGVSTQADYIRDSLDATLKSANINLSQKSLDAISGALQGAAYGQAGGSVFASITGGRENKLASGIGGALGEVAGKELGPAIAKTIGGSLGKTLGGAAGPIGAVLGGVLGNVIGGLFTKAPKGSAGVSVSNGAISAGAASGTTADAKSGAATLAGSVANGLEKIASILGAKVTGTTDVQIGTYKGELRVNDRGGAIGGVKGSGALSFASEEAAIAYAISDALRDGVLSGISAAALKILQSGKDLETSIEKALLIESIPRDLKAALDPVGAAIDALNEKWRRTIDALEEGGATAEQMAQAQQLYNIQLEQTKSSASSASQGLKDFLTNLRGGSNSPFSLRTQERDALNTLQPFLDKIGSGAAIDQSKYQSAAQQFLDIERQLYGSTKAYFDAFDVVQAATNKAIATLDNVSPITPGVPDPFTKATADNTAKAASAAQVGNEMTEQTNALLQRMAEAIERMGGGSIETGFLTEVRMYA